MDIRKNKIPKDIRTIHLIAVCGTGMGALASMLQELGFDVTGSDQNVYPPMSTFLRDKRVKIAKGFAPENLDHRPDLVVVGNAVSRNNPEVEALDRMGLNYCSMPQAINRFVVAGKKPILVTGTHGKTTTASIMAWVLHAAGLDPAFVIGGILQNFQSNYRLGAGPYIVLEGDEYDTAFFDKGAKFFHYAPHAAILTSVEFDHADIFTDLNHVKRTFGRFAGGIAPDSTLVAFDGDPNVSELIEGCRCRVVPYGKAAKSPWRLGTVSVAPPWTQFKVLKNNQPYACFRTKLIGEHNMLNALSVIAVADRLKIPLTAIRAGLETFQGARRRQEVRGVKRGITVIDDFAHHPTAVKETVNAVKSFYNTHRLIAVFEPRTNSSMRDIFQDVYPDSFGPADMVCIRKPPLLKKIPVGQRFSSEQLVADLVKKGKAAFFFPDTEAIIDHLTAESQSGDVILIMSNGGFDNIHERLLEKL